MALATGVLLWHSFALQTTPLPNLPIALQYLLSGSVMVDGFFVISGFLVFSSAQRSKSFVHFATNRVSRIFPGLFICLCFTAFVLAPIIASHESVKLAWFEAPFYVLANMFLFPMKWGISTLLAENPVSRSWNGSLWSLQWEVLAYLIIWFVSRRMKISKPILISFAILATVANFLIVAASLSVFSSNFIFDLLSTGSRLGLMFSVGALLCLFSHNIPLRIWLALPSVALLYLSLETKNYSWMAPIFWGYVLLYLGSRLKSPSFFVNNDFSFGLYIYAFPIQQFLIATGNASTNVWVFFCQALSISGVLAVSSWFLVEKPALKKLRPKITSWLEARQS
jgi:peptidoglycan/LPS O-acetylase OafA/YrhL